MIDVSEDGDVLRRVGSGRRVSWRRLVQSVKSGITHSRVGSWHCECLLGRHDGPENEMREGGDGDGRM